jgi:DNA transposition AAA+ family ATPase
MKQVKFPENLKLKEAIKAADRSVKGVAKSIGYNRCDVSNTINGHKKGIYIVPAIKKELGLQ